MHHRIVIEICIQSMSSVDRPLAEYHQPQLNFSLSHYALGHWSGVCLCVCVCGGGGGAERDRKTRVWDIAIFQKN